MQKALRSGVLLCCRFSFHLSCARAPSKRLKKNEAAYTITPFINCRARRTACMGRSIKFTACSCPVFAAGRPLSQPTHQRAETKFNFTERSELFFLFIFQENPVSNQKPFDTPKREEYKLREPGGC
jgi:hypothetical protein